MSKSLHAKNIKFSKDPSQNNLGTPNKIKTHPNTTKISFKQNKSNKNKTFLVLKNEDRGYFFQHLSVRKRGNNHRHTK